MSTLEQNPSAMSPPSTGAYSRATEKPQRLLACVRCQHRKVKCDHKFPCTNCHVASAQCVPGTPAARQRRRRFPERELLKRLRTYEELLSKNSIDFEPLHPLAGERSSPSAGAASHDSPGNDSSPNNWMADQSAREEPGVGSPSVKSETDYETKSFWQTLKQRYREPPYAGDSDDSGDSPRDIVSEPVVRKAWETMYASNDHLLFGLRGHDIDLFTLHPKQNQIFRLWQTYLENVNPLLKVTHTPTLQARIIDAAGDLVNINPTLEALMFSIYCMSVVSLSDDDCRAVFGSPKEDLLASYQLGCQQALLKCGFLKSNDRACLTALHLYLISVGSCTDPRPLSSMLSVAIRTAQRIGIDSESANAKCSVFDAEMRRRLWWSLVLFDSRICGLANLGGNNTLTPTWDCKVPLNVDDCDLWPEMKTAPTARGRTSEALFAVVRSEMGDAVRFSPVYLSFTNPILKKIAETSQRGSARVGPNGEEVSLGNVMEKDFLQYCNPENPLHFMTIWTVRSHLARSGIVEDYSKDRTAQQGNAQLDGAVFHAINLLDCDTKIITSPLTKGYIWQVQFYFPFPAYLHLVHHLKKRPDGEHAAMAWKAMTDNYRARSLGTEERSNPVFEILATAVLQAWEARKAVFQQLNKDTEPLWIVSDIMDRLTKTKPKAQYSTSKQSDAALDMSLDDFAMSMPFGVGGSGLLYGMDGQGLQDDYSTMSNQATMDIDVNQLDWTKIDWNQTTGRGW